MDEHALPASGTDPAHEVATLLRGVADRQLTPQHSADLDEVLAELELLVRSGDDAALSRANGDLRIIDTTAGWGSPAATPVSRAQRDRIKRLIPALQHERKRTMRPWRR
jgi:hypothetical protein